MARVVVRSGHLRGGARLGCRQTREWLGRTARPLQHILGCANGYPGQFWRVEGAPISQLTGTTEGLMARLLCPVTSNVKLGVNLKPLLRKPCLISSVTCSRPGPQLTHRAFHSSGSTCTTSLRPHATQNRGGSVAARRARHWRWAPLASGFPQPSQCSLLVITSRRAP